MKVYFFSIQTKEPPIFDPQGPLPTPLEDGDSPHYLCCSSQEPDTIIEICRHQNLIIARLEEDIPLFRRWAFRSQMIDPSLYNNKHCSTLLYSGDAEYGFTPVEKTVSSI